MIITYFLLARQVAACHLWDHTAVSCCATLLSVDCVCDLFLLLHIKTKTNLYRIQTRKCITHSCWWL